MNILLVTSGMDNGGAETHVFELVTGLTARGHSVTLASSGGRLADALCREGVAQIRLPLHKKTPVALFHSFRGLRRLLEKRRFDVVHAHTRIAAAVSDRLCEKKGIPLVTTIHAYLRPNRLLHKLSRWGRATVAVSADLRRYLLLYCRGVRAENITVIPNGIDTSRYIPDGSAKEEGVTRIAFLSRLDGDCSAAAYSLCRIAADLDALVGKRTRIEIIIGGGGKELSSLRREAERVNRQVGRELARVVGAVEDTVSFMRTADIFVGVSRAALEAMSCAVPVALAGDEGFLGVVTEASLEGAEESNFCCRGTEPLGDNVLLSAIVTLIDMTPSQRKELGETLRSYVCRSHSAELMAERTEEAYRSTVKRARRLGGGDGKGGVLLCGYYGYGNMGDELLLDRAVRRAAERTAAFPVSALTKGGRRDSAEYGVRCVGRRSPFSAARAIRRADTVVFGGGTLLQNGSSRRSLRYYLFLLRTAQKAGKRVELWGNGVDDIKGKRDRRAAAVALSACSYVGLRDRASADNVRTLVAEQGLPMPRIRLEKDLVESYPSPVPHDSQRVVRELLGFEGRRVAIIAPKGRREGKTAKSLAAWVKKLTGEGMTPVFVAMYPSEDLKLCEKMRSEIGGRLVYPVCERDMLCLMSKAELVCGMRYHALVLASIAGTPFVGFGDEQKIRSFCRSHGGVYHAELV